MKMKGHSLLSKLVNNCLLIPINDAEKDNDLAIYLSDKLFFEYEYDYYLSSCICCFKKK